MNKRQHNETGGEKPKYFEKIRAAITKKQGLSFVYEREDGEIITHNAVYPRHLFQKGNQFYFRAYCYFTRDTRVFRLDRIKSLQLKQKREPLTRKQKILEVVGAVVMLFLVFLLLLLFSRRYLWRSLRHFIFTYIGIE
jgi:predicted DNA-binding transcriptional regulator YafY